MGILFRLLILMMLLSTSACSVLSVADAAVSVVATGVKVTAKTVGVVADVIIPDSDDDDE
jgi:hypothetical protein